MAGMALPRSMAALYGRGIDRGLVLGGGGVWFVAWQTGYLRRLEELGLGLGSAGASHSRGGGNTGKFVCGAGTGDMQRRGAEGP